MSQVDEATDGEQPAALIDFEVWRNQKWVRCGKRPGGGHKCVPMEGGGKKCADCHMTIAWA